MKTIISKSLVVALLAAMLSCAKDHQFPAAKMKTYVIVPGAWSAPNAWATVQAGLEKSGNKVLVVQLPGHGSDQTPPQNLNMDYYRDFVISSISNISGKVILVGHSLGGMVISEIAEKAPERIEKLIYLAAFVPVNGQSLLDLAGTDATSVTGAALRPPADNLTLDVLHDQIVSGFIQDGTVDEQNFVLTNFKVEPAIPFTNKVTLTAAKYGTVPKVYIKTLMDQTVTPDLQKRMLAATPSFAATYQLNTGHSPFLVKPDSVAILLTKIAQ